MSDEKMTSLAKKNVESTEPCGPPACDSHTAASGRGEYELAKRMFDQIGCGDEVVKATKREY